jgi:transcriptional antiterminator NusG
MSKIIDEPDDDFSVGLRIKILDGPWVGFAGVIYSIDLEKKMVVVMINFWGKDTPVELSFTQIKPFT